MLKQMFSLVALCFPLNATEFFVPDQFKQGETINHLILISDVDGVIRASVDSIVDPRIIAAIKQLLNHENVDVTFISGSPAGHSKPQIQPWQAGNKPLHQAFENFFDEELSEERVHIFGLVGGHRMKAGGSFEVMDCYSPEVTLELETLLIQAFLHQVVQDGSSTQKQIAKSLLSHLETIQDGSLESTILEIRKHLDPDFRLLTHDAIIETHISNPPWNSSFGAKWLKEEINNPKYLASKLEPWQRYIASGFAKRGDTGFNFLLISKTNKGITIGNHLEEKVFKSPQTLIVTIGDTQIDFPMHEKADLAFHVGLEKVWQNNTLPHCVMIRDIDGKDAQHVEGTLRVLNNLINSIGHSFYDLKYIEKQNSLGHWDYYSINELQQNNL
jgi:hypothetical protein